MKLITLKITLKTKLVSFNEIPAIEFENLCDQYPGAYSYELQVEGWVILFDDEIEKAW